MQKKKNTELNEAFWNWFVVCTSYADYISEFGNYKIIHFKIYDVKNRVLQYPHKIGAFVCNIEILFNIEKNSYSNLLKKVLSVLCVSHTKII